MRLLKSEHPRSGMMMDLNLGLSIMFTAQSQPQTPASCPNRSPLSCFNTSINGPTSAVETNKILTFREVDHPTSVITSRKISQNIQSSSSAAASSLTSLTNTNRPPLSLLGILAAKRITRKFLSTLADEKHQRRLSTFSRLWKMKILRYNTACNNRITLDGKDSEDVKTLTYMSSIIGEHEESDARALYLQLKNT
ncbi:unnamed protein product [Schistosoma curassoni]|uniref:Uncharacterized protein n=1 Tax=Schistosoma curassoni TaxID=6186 RepID=A0A183KMP0_9TREM|nr:unnamed protein product [Schistosoma curassoni]